MVDESPGAPGTASTNAGSVVEKFSPATRAWFTGTFAEPTQAQAGAWEAISRGDHTLVVAPTGSGKTLSAFLWGLDQLVSQPTPDDVNKRCRVLYISPMKALGVDVERNLTSPLVGIGHAAARLGMPVPHVDVAVRSGDTTPAARRAFSSKSSDILITTPESLFLLLTSAARERLHGVEYVIIDEIHAVAGTKRGAHLAVSLDRLDALLDRPAQRIGLSATVRPIAEIERFLAGGHPVTTVQPPTSKTWDLQVVVPVEDMADLANTPAPAPDYDEHAPERTASIWPHLEERIVDLITNHTSTLVFANSRRLAERLTSRLNEIWAERLAHDVSGDGTVGQENAPAPHPPAQLMGASGMSQPAPAELARAHHGSVSKDVRLQIESDLKAGRLPAVVATSSLELGIDMGAIDLVIQVESPPSVASGLQRIGRAGHQVGATSHGVVFPKFRSDLLSAAVVVEQMQTGGIEQLHVLNNPLDVLAQHVVATVALEDWSRRDLLELFRRSASFAGLTEDVFDAVLDMLSGLYPSDAFRELRARIVWDRDSDVLSARPGAQRLAVTSGGTIPDRGLYGVFLAGSEGPGRRVGELDEEMVYESRVGDVFTLGTSTWRIEDITRDQVLVTPAPGQAARLPFWKGDALGRPAELGAHIGAFARTLSSLPEADALRQAKSLGLDELAAKNLVAYLTQQRESTGHVPSDKTLVVERFRDEIGDWRIVVHSPFGAAVHAPWALAVAARMRESTGANVQAMHTDDGLVFRLLDTDGDDDSLTQQLIDAIVLSPDEIDRIVTDEVGSTPLFAARFRECAARALLLPRRSPGKRQALWQQRQRAAQLLEVAADYPRFPIVLEAMRECLQDVYDVPGLKSLMTDVARSTVRLVHVETSSPSPYAKSILFSYVAQYLYEGDSPLAERRAAALSLDPQLLADLLGTEAGLEIADLLDPEVISSYERRLQRLDEPYRLKSVEHLADALRTLGPLTHSEIVARTALAAPDSETDSSAEPSVPDDSEREHPIGTGENTLAQEWWNTLVDARRAIVVRWGGQERLAAIEDAARLRDALGVALPAGVPAAFLEPVRDPLADLIIRFAATHAPFSARQLAAYLGVGEAVARTGANALARTKTLTFGRLLPESLGGTADGEYASPDVLGALRRMSLAAARNQVAPVEPGQFTQFLASWQHLGEDLYGADGLLVAMEGLIGIPLPASAVESLILPARMPKYRPSDLDEVLSRGELLWQGCGAIGANDGWVSFHFPDQASLTLRPHGETSVDVEALRERLGEGGSHLFGVFADLVSTSGTAETSGLWDAVWAGYLSGDTFAPVRARLGAGSGAHKTRTRAPRSSRYARLRAPSLSPRGGGTSPASALRVPTDAQGRWFMLPPANFDATHRGLAQAETLLARYGIVTRTAVKSEDVPGGFAAVYRVLAQAEESGLVRRGYFVEGLGASQFATSIAVDTLRATKSSAQGGQSGRGVPDYSAPDPWSSPSPTVRVLAACDPANPYGAVLPWPEATNEHTGHRPARKAGSLVVLVDDACVAYIERGGRSVLTWPTLADVAVPAAQALAQLVETGRLDQLTVKTINGISSLTSTDPLADALKGAGFHTGPQGIRRRR